jgi:hypothetical protein
VGCGRVRFPTATGSGIKRSRIQGWQVAVGVKSRWDKGGRVECRDVLDALELETGLSSSLYVIFLTLYDLTLLHRYHYSIRASTRLFTRHPFQATLKPSSPFRLPIIRRKSAATLVDTGQLGLGCIDTRERCLLYGLCCSRRESLASVTHPIYISFRRVIYPIPPKSPVPFLLWVLTPDTIVRIFPCIPKPPLRMSTLSDA